MSNDKSLKNKSLDYWKQKLTTEQFEITRKKATEAPFSGKYDKFYEEGDYRCVSCGKALFDSDSKFDAGCGWPSFDKPVKNASIETQDDNTLGMKRTEVLCQSCNAHLGHVFDDGPTDTGQRYCINSAALQFHKKE